MFVQCTIISAIIIHEYACHLAHFRLGINNQTIEHKVTKYINLWLDYVPLWNSIELILKTEVWSSLGTEKNMYGTNGKHMEIWSETAYPLVLLWKDLHMARTSIILCYF